MNIYLFLEGPPRIGKSTLIRKNLLPYAASVAGMVVQRLYENGSICGYRACLAEGCLPSLEAEYTDDFPGVFLYRGKSHPKILDQMISRALALCEKSSCKLILLDEIGGVELSSEIFRKSFHRILSIGKPCIGVVKSRENLTNTLKKLNFSDELLEESKLLHSRIRDGGEVLLVNRNNLKKTDQCIKLFIRDIIKPKL